MLEFLLWLYAMCAAIMAGTIVFDWQTFKEDVLDELQAQHPNSVPYYTPIAVAVLGAPLVYAAVLVDVIRLGNK